MDDPTQPTQKSSTPLKKRITSLVPLFGANRASTERVTHHLTHCGLVGVPFAGSFAEVPYLLKVCRVVAANDLHRHILNLAMVAKVPALREQLLAELDGMPFHRDVLLHSQQRTQAWRWHGDLRPDVQAAKWYFIAAWMGRSGDAGTTRELASGFSPRFNAGGGSSIVRFVSARESLAEFGEAIRATEISCLDAFEFLKKIGDHPLTGLYVDSPWPDASLQYVYDFAARDYERLQQALTAYANATVVVRYCDHPLIRQLYQTRDGWRFEQYVTRKQSNNSMNEVLIIRNSPHDPYEPPPKT